MIIHQKPFLRKSGYNFNDGSNVLTKRWPAMTDKHKFLSFHTLESPQYTSPDITVFQFPRQNTQTIFCKKREHWIMASNMLITDDSTVNVYDSMFDELDQEVSTLIQQIFHGNSNSSGVRIIMKNLQKQHGSTDCGIFTIVFGLQGRSK